MPHFGCAVVVHYIDDSLDARIVACIHDSIWIEASAEEEEEARDIMERVMTTAINLSVPLLVDFEG